MRVPDAPIVLERRRKAGGRFCTWCDTELNPPAWKWAIGLTVSIGILTSLAITTGWILWLPFGPIATVFEYAARKLRRKDWDEGFNLGFQAGWATAQSEMQQTEAELPPP